MIDYEFKEEKAPKQNFRLLINKELINIFFTIYSIFLILIFSLIIGGNQLPSIINFRKCGFGWSIVYVLTIFQMFLLSLRSYVN